jgi:hypothetical protein
MGLAMETNVRVVSAVTVGCGNTKHYFLYSTAGSNILYRSHGPEGAAQG